MDELREEDEEVEAIEMEVFSACCSNKKIAITYLDAKIFLPNSKFFEAYLYQFSASAY